MGEVTNSLYGNEPSATRGFIVCESERERERVLRELVLLTVSREAREDLYNQSGPENTYTLVRVHSTRLKTRAEKSCIAREGGRAVRPQDRTVVARLSSLSRAGRYLLSATQ